MIAIAKGSITEPDKLGPLVDDEKRVARQLKAEGLMKAVYLSVAGHGTFSILEGESMDAMREGMNTLPFVVAGLMTLEYEEVKEI
jgi:muconolactone delta-isomerase